MRTKILILIAVVAVLSSCTKEDSISGSSERALLQFTTVNQQEKGEVATRALKTSPYDTSKEIGFYVKADATHQYLARNNYKGTYSTARKLWLPQDSIWLNENNADILVYAPYDNTLPADGKVDLTAREYTETDSKHYMYKRFTANCYTHSPTVTLGFAYARFVITVTRHENYPTGTTYIGGCKLKGDQIYEKAEFRPMNSSPYTYGATKDVIITLNPTKTLDNSTTSVSFDYLLVPTSLTGDVTVDITVDSKPMRAVLKANLFTGSKLEEGKQYNVTIKLKPSELEVTAVTITGWTDEIITDDNDTWFE